MAEAGPLRWRSGAGWLVLAGGGGDDTGTIDTAVLSWAIPNRPTAILLTGGNSALQAEQLLDNWADLGGSTGFVVPIYGPSDAHSATNRSLLEQAGLICIGDGPDALSLVLALAQTPVLDAIGEAYEDGTPVLAVGAAAAAMGAWVAERARRDRGEPGWAWLPDVIVEPRFAGSQRAAGLRAALAAHPEWLGLGIPAGSALALGPAGRVVSLGQGQVTVVLWQGGDQEEAGTPEPSTA